MSAVSVKVHTPTDSPKAERRPWRCERGETCRSPDHHDSLHGYRAGCRSGAARRFNAAYQAKKRAGLTAVSVPGIGVARRLQALHALGFSDPYMAERLGTNKARLQVWRKGRDRVWSTTHEDVAWLYLELSEAEPTGPLVKRTQNWARKAGEQLPEAWDPDDGSIDDPDAEPYQWRPSGWDQAVAARRERRTREKQERMAEVADMVRAGMNTEAMARVLGVSERTVWRYRSDLDHHQEEDAA